MKALLVALTLSSGASPPSAVMPDGAIKVRIISESIRAYQATGHRCACPYNTQSSGSSCGRASAYIARPAGVAPVFCYPGDVTDNMVADWRKAHIG